MQRLIILPAVFFLTLFSLSAQNGYEQPPIVLKRTSELIKLDGVLDEPAWFSGAPAKNFWSNFPTDSVQAEVQTEIYMTYDDNFLYVAAKCYSTGKDYIVPSLRRDFRAGGNDNITFLFDPFNDRTNAFVFGINPYGVLREALISNGGGGRGDWNGSWDNKWNGVSEIHDGYWICELAIPFSTLRFTEGQKEWNFNSYRFDTQTTSRSSWIRIPRNQIIMSLAYMGTMEWEEPLKKTGGNISLIPFITSGVSQVFDPEKEDANSTFDLGGDAKIAISSGMNLDLTFNPDFSQVEVDRQVTNLDRFEIFFPERRQFFLENSDLFGRFGDSRINPFFSRRIGVARDTSAEQNIQNSILFGARLSGKLNDNWRLGLLNMQTARDEDNGLPSFNYTVAALQRKIFSRSNIGFIFVNKQRFGGPDSSDLFNPYNRVAGIDYNLASSDNSWTGKVYYHRSFSPDQPNQTFAHGLNVKHIKRRYSMEWNHQWVGENYNPEVGFVPRKDFFRIRPEARLFFYPAEGILAQHGPGIETSILWTPENGRTDHEIELFWDMEFREGGRGRITLSNEYTFLLDEFNPTRKDTFNLPAMTGYNYTSIGGFLSSDRRRKISFSFRPSLGQFFSGQRYGIGGSITYRYQPFGQISLNFNYNYINLPDPFSPTSIFLIGPRIDLTFSKDIFLTTFIQYNDQIDNISINARLQWRFAPVSDFFLVYTDNYYATDLKVKNRAIVAKLTYWLNL